MNLYEAEANNVAGRKKAAPLLLWRRTFDNHEMMLRMMSHRRERDRDIECAGECEVRDVNLIFSAFLVPIFTLLELLCKWAGCNGGRFRSP